MSRKNKKKNMKKQLRIISLIAILAIFGLSNIANAQWIKVSDLTKKAGTDIAITVFGINDGSIYIADYWNRYTSRSDDNGKTWTKIYANMFVSMVFSGTNIYATDGTGIYLSTNKGTNWTTISNTSVKGILCIELVGTTLYAGVGNSGVYRTTDNGTNWTLLSNGFNGTATQHTIHYISSGNGKLYASTDYGIYVSSNNGDNWSALTAAAWPSSSGRATGAGVSAVNGSTIYAKTLAYPTSELFVTTDAGTSWKKANTTELTHAICLQGSCVIIGSDSGVFSSTDNGTTWINQRSSDFIAGKKTVYSLVSDGTNIYAGTYSDLWKRPISEFTSTGIPNLNVGTMENLNVFPNPSTGMINIEWNNNSPAKMQILNVLGKVITEEQITSKTTINLTTQGIYFVKIIDGTNLYIKEFIVR
jgi:photosystem II stability/assembly factor-like uncharacterized protein